jgi:hypothetical protein
MDCRLRRQILGHGLASNLLGELGVGAMAGVVGLGTMTARFSAGTGRTGNRTRLEVTKFGNLLEQCGSFIDECRQRVKQGVASFLKYSILSESGPKKRTLAIPHFYGAHSHPVWVLTVSYPGGGTKQVSLRPEQKPVVEQWLRNYHKLKDSLERICEINLELLRTEKNK